MTTKTKIKVIKKNDLKVIKKPENTEQKVQKETTREMVLNVSNWVSDFQKRKREDTIQAFENFFPPSPQTDGV